MLLLVIFIMIILMIIKYILIGQCYMPYYMILEGRLVHAGPKEICIVT